MSGSDGYILVGDRRECYAMVICSVCDGMLWYAGQVLQDDGTDGCKCKCGPRESYVLADDDMDSYVLVGDGRQGYAIVMC